MTPEIFHVATFNSPRSLSSAAYLMLMYGDGTNMPVGLIHAMIAVNKQYKFEKSLLAAIKNSEPFQISCSYGPPKMYGPDEVLANLMAIQEMQEENDESRTVQLSKQWPDPASDRLPSRQQARRPARLPSTYG